MAQNYTLSPNLKLRLDPNLTANAKFNLTVIDAQAGVTQLTQNGGVVLRSAGDITVEPASPDVGGSGYGGSVFFGTPDHALTAVTFYTSSLTLGGSLTLLDTAGSGHSVGLRYTAASIPTTDSTLALDTVGAPRSLTLGGNLTVSGGPVSLLSGGTGAVTLPASGTLATLAGAETLTGKQIDASLNTLSNVPPASLQAGIPYSKLVLSGSVVGGDLASNAAVPYSKLALGASVTDSDISPTAAISRQKLALGTPLSILANSADGHVTEQAVVSRAQGGLGFDASGLSSPTTGVLLTADSTATVTGKQFSGSTNTFTAIPYGALVLTGSLTNTDVATGAAISYSKLSLTGSVTNSDVAAGAAISYSKLALTGSITGADISPSAAIPYTKLALNNTILNSDISAVAGIAGNKVIPHFGTQDVTLTGSIVYSLAGHNTTLQPAHSGQLGDVLFELPPNNGTAAQVLATDGAGHTAWTTVGGTGTVTSVQVTAPAEFVVTGNPITTSGTINLAWAPETAGTILAGPTTGSPGTPSYRALVTTDLPTGIPATSVGAGTVDNTELGYLDGVTSPLQAQINGKQPTGSYITALTGGVTASGPGSSAATVVSVGGQTAAAVATAATQVAAATSANTPSTLVARDASGNFSAGVVTASLSGNATTATSATTAASATSFTGSLAGDVTGTQGATVVALVGGSTAAAVHTAELAANGATSANTSGKLVTRDGSGNFSAGTITASLTGNASTATSAAQVTATSNSTLTTLTALSLPGTQVTGTVPAATTATTAGNVTGTVAVANGGTGLTSTSVGGLLVGSSTSAYATLPVGSNGYVLTSNGTTAAWAPTASTLGSYKTTWSSGTSFVATHSLGTADVRVELYDIATGVTIWVDSVVRNSTSQVTLTSSTAAPGTGWRVLIVSQP